MCCPYNEVLQIVAIELPGFSTEQELQTLGIPSLKSSQRIQWVEMRYLNQWHDPNPLSLDSVGVPGIALSKYFSKSAIDLVVDFWGDVSPP